MRYDKNIVMIEEATTLVMAMFGYHAIMSDTSNVGTSTIDIYSPVEQLYQDGFMAKFAFNENNYLVLNNDTILKVREFFKKELASISQGIRIVDFELPHVYYLEMPEILIRFLRKLPKELCRAKINGIDLYFGESENTRNYYEKYVRLFLLSLSVTPVQIGSFFYYIAKDNFFKDVITKLTMNGLCESDESRSRRNKVVLSKKGRMEGIRLLEKYLPNAPKDIIDLYSHPHKHRFNQNPYNRVSPSMQWKTRCK